VLDESDNPIEGIWVAVTTPDGEDYLAGASTNDAGVYLIEELAAGDVSILVGGIGTSWVETATPTTLLADQIVTVNFVLTPRMTGAVSGTVVDGDTLGIDKVCGTVYDTTSGDAISGFPETDSSGAFFVDDLDVGTYTLLFWDCDFQRTPAFTTVFLGNAVSIDSAVSFSILTGDTTELGAAALTLGATISGTVRLRAGTGSIALPASRGVDALVYVLDGSTWAEFPDPSPFVSAGGPGEYQVSGLPEATYRVALGDPATGVKAYTRVYWQNALDFDDATNITVTGSTAITGIDAIVEVARPGYQPTPISTESLTADVAGDVSTPDDDLMQNETTDVEVGDEFAGEWVSIWGHSTPVQMGGWVQVGADGMVTVPVPTSLPAGAHQLAAQDAEGNLIGWTDVTVTAAASSGGALSSTGLDRDNAILFGMLAAALLTLGAVLVIARSRQARASSAN